MTSLTGKTEAVCAPTRDPPSFGLAMFGAVARRRAHGLGLARERGHCVGRQADLDGSFCSFFDFLPFAHFKAKGTS